MLKNWKEKIKTVPRYVWILLAIVLVGIFLRTYHFHDWLIFNSDQVRDTILVEKVIDGKIPWPLLGPQAGNTMFSLGPLYYYFQIVSVKIFGDTPDKMAYPDLLFSILAIPLLFFFLKKYFSNNLSLALTALMSLSYFAIVNSRFASNPNSIPFFTLLFLFALLEMLDLSTEPFDKLRASKYVWPILAGIAVGVGIQLHALLFVIMPIMTGLVVVYLFLKKNLNWKSVLLIAVFFVLMNVGQIKQELTTGGENVKQLFRGANSEAKVGNNFTRNLGYVVVCQVQYNVHMVSSYENIEQCGGIFKGIKSVRKYADVPGNLKTETLFELGMIASVIFSLGGYLLLGYYWRRETDRNKKNFLGLVLLYNFISLLILLPVASQISLRYYIILAAVPFVLLGLWAKLFLEKIRKVGVVAVPVLFGLLIFSNLLVDWKASAAFRRGEASTATDSILGEMEPLANFIVAQNGQNQRAYVGGDKRYLKRFYKPLDYLVGRQGISLSSDYKSVNLQTVDSIFYITATGVKNKKWNGSYMGKTVASTTKFKKIIIMILK